MKNTTSSDNTCRENNKKPLKKYLAIGDSITTGYGLKEGKSNFVTMLAESKEMTLIANLAIDGQKASELSCALEKDSSEYTTYRQAIESADVVTITIGGNDLMAAFYSLVAELMGDGYTAENVYKILTDPLNNLLLIFNILFKLSSNDFSAEIANSNTFNAAVTACISNINDIASKIKEINPDARILIANQYNPYKWLPGYQNIVNIFETGVKHYNAQFKQNASSDFDIVDIYSVFNASEAVLTNADLSVFNLDFHPNSAGHRAIAAEMMTALGNNL